MNIIARTWNTLIRTGHHTGMDSTQEMRLLTLNAFVVVSFLLTVLFIASFTAVGSYSALEGLSVIPILIFVLYCNHRRWHRFARLFAVYMLLAVVLVLALSDRRTGTEYVLIALGCCSAFIFESRWTSAVTFAVAFACYAFYMWYDSTTPFVEDPTVPYVVARNFLMLTGGLTVFAQSMVFLQLINKYADRLSSANHDVATVNEELRASNEELQTFSENLDKMVQQKSAHLQAYIDAIDVSMYSVLTDIHGRFVHVNDQIVSTSGYTRDELIGSHYSLLGSGNHPDEFFSDRRNFLMSGNSWRGEVEHKTKTGELLWFDCVVAPIYDADGKIAQFLTLGLPITERKANEKMREETSAVLEAIAFRTSHKVRGPLARIQGLSQLVKMDMLQHDEFKFIAEKLVVCTQEVSSATGELLRYVYDHQELINSRLEK